MASRRRNMKRKSNDYIYEINENDLSPDDSCEESLSKVPKISSDKEASEKTISHNLEPTEDSIENGNSQEENSSTQLNNIQTNEEDASDDSEKIIIKESVPEKDNEDTNEMKNDQSIKINSEQEIQRDMGVIEVTDSDVDLDCSVEIIKESIPVLVVSDELEDSADAATEEGEISEVLEVVDEVGQTPSITETLEIQDDADEAPNEDITETFEVVDEVGSTPKVDDVVEVVSTPRVDDVDEVVSPPRVDDDIMINISFKNEEIKRCYETNILNFLASFSEFEVTSSDLSIRVKEVPDVHIDISNLKTPKKKHKKKKAKKELFVVDTTPSSMNDSQIVKYASKFNIEEEKCEDVTTPRKVTSAQTCFNCGEVHALKDCKVPKNYSKINAARQKFMSNKNKSARYHEEEDQKYSHLKPGIISDNLRHALGLRKNELPSYIYGMRVLGYPPGWLEEAKFVHSSLRMFDIDGGKVKENKDNRQKGLDAEKIIEYPGFNAPIGKGFHDDYKKYKVCPYSKNLAKEYMLKHFENLCEEEDSSETSDMDLDMGNEINKKGVTKLLQRESSSCESPSLTDLEKKKIELLAQLSASNSNNQSSSTLENNNLSQNDEVKNYHKPIIVKSTALGTPILKSSSPYSQLPNPDNFMVGVSPVIDFENLPNSTGKYEQMSEVLTKVRNTLKTLENCKS